MPYVKSYFKAFYNRCVTTDEWRQHLYDFYSGSPEITAKLNTIDWDAWLHGEGLELPVKMEYDTTLAEHAYALATRWIKVITAPGKAENEKFGANDIKGWNTNQIIVFLEKLHAGPRVPPPMVKRLDDAYGFSNAKNGEILLRFYEVALEAEGGVYARKAAEWVKNQGRMKICRPIYRALLKVEPELAEKTFMESKSFYHPIAAAMIEKVSFKLLPPPALVALGSGNDCPCAPVLLLSSSGSWTCSLNYCEFIFFAGSSLVCWR